MIAIIPSAGHNLSSVVFALQRLGVEPCITADPKQLFQATHVILPGVGAAGHGMSVLKSLNLLDVIPQLTQPVLGICLGMQLLFEYSEEDNAACLGIIPGKVKKFMPQMYFSLPHMGWNQLTQKITHGLFTDVQNSDFCYFVHSYYVPVTKYTLAVTNYIETFTSIVQHNNFLGMQFHPERSGAVGRKLLNNFLKMSV